MENKYKILLVDDEASVHDALKQMLSADKSVELFSCYTGKDSVRKIAESPRGYALVLMDYRLPDISGADATREILKINPDQIVAMNSGDQSREAALESWRAGAVDFIEKTWPSDQIKLRIQACIEKYKESSEVFTAEGSAVTNNIFEEVGIVGASPEMALVCDKVKRASLSEASVLVLGESGGSV